MSEQNPYIVREEEGKAATIRDFVTGIPLKPDEMLADEHGIHPVSPLGFLNKDDDATVRQLGVHGWTSGFVPTKVDDNVEEAYLKSYVVTGKYTVLTGRYIAFPVLGITRSGNILDVTVEGTVPTDEEQRFFFRNTTSDDYSVTGLVTSGEVPDSWNAVDIVHDGDRTSLSIEITGNIQFNGIVGAGKLDMCVDTAKTYLCLTGADTTGLSGIYLPGSSDGLPFNKVYSYGERYNAECYASNGYSDREVAEWVHKKLGPVLNYANHPYSDIGNLTGAGAFTRWFASCADIDVSGGMGHAQVMVPGFGLGAGYTNTCNSAILGVDSEKPKLESTGWLTFGYGTKHDAFDSAVGKTALPLDWPFTEVSDATEQSENNITLVKDGVDVNGTVLGALAKYDECQTCEGTGEVDGEECPDCCGTGYARTGTVKNRVHVCLYNDFKPGEDSAPYDDTTILKKTFINLGTSLDTDDGDEFEITVSLPNINVDQAFPISGNAEKNQNGYYAFISQPRVYVVSGTWKFSDTMVNVRKESSTNTTIAIDKAFLDANGTQLDGIRIRFTMKGSGYPVETSTFTGVVSGTTITLDGCQKVNFTRGVSYSICGAAYLEDNNETLPEGSTPIGLNNVRRTDGGALGPDYSTGGGVQVYNRIYGAGDGESDEEREKVILQSDKRQIVATVYPTVTNTFAWELSGKKTLNNLDRLMTMDAEYGSASIMGKIADMNRRILMGHPAFISAAQGDFGLGPEEYPIDLAKVADALLDDDDSYSYMGKVIQVSDSVSDDNGQYRPESNPVRQAIRAVQLLAEDYRNARVRGDTIEVGADDVFMKNPRSIDSDWNDIFNSTDYDVATGSPVNVDVETARTIRLRNLANIVSQTSSNEDHTPISPLLGLAPYVWQDGDSHEVSEFHTGNPYEYGEYDTTDALQETTCDFVNNTYGKNYVENSIAMACLRKQPSWLDDPDAVNDLFRAVEIASIELSSDAYKAYSATSISKTMRPFNAFANIVSPDNIPVSMSEAPYNSIDTDDDMVKWYGGDAYYYYWLRKGYGNHLGNSKFGWIATTMDNEEPVYTELTEFLANYIPSYGADLTMRNWDSFRVKVKKTEPDTTDLVYLTRMKWYGTSCSADNRGKYAADAFIGSNIYQDVNLNRTRVPDVAHNYSSTPYALGGEFNPSGDSPCAPLNSDTDHGAVAYIRVFMKFTFSADAGRWYCTDYRQAPVSYLTPLYGAQALEEKIDDKRIWIPSTCSNVSWKMATRMLYDDYQPHDINPALVAEVMTERDGSSRIMKPFDSVVDNGLGLSAPKDRSGTTDGMLDGQSANFWSVRENLRPATGALPGTDIPSYQKNSSTGEWEHGHTDGIMSDAVLWGQYDYPTKREIEFHLPDVETPDADLTKRRLIYAIPNPNTGEMYTGDIQVGPSETVISISNGSGHN